MNHYPRYPNTPLPSSLPPAPHQSNYNEPYREYKPQPYQQQGSISTYDPPQPHGLPPPPHQSYGNQNNNDRGGSAGGHNQNGRDRGIPPPAPMRDYGDRGNGRGRGEKMKSPDNPPPRRWLDETEKLQESIFIADRRAKEKPCRTLFVRNVSYEADNKALRVAFEQYGEIKTWFDLIGKRGMAFITYFDMRAAERAQEAMHNTKVEGRTMDVHYSLPRVEDMQGECDREKGQGSLSAGLRNGRSMNVDELGRLATRFGDIRSIKPGLAYGEHLVEYFDTRAVVRFHDEMHDKPFGGGILNLRFVWDETAPPVQSASMRGDRDEGRRNPGGQGGPQRSGDRGYGGRGGDRERSPNRGRRESDFSRDNGGGRRDNYPSGPPNRYNEAPPIVPVPDDRLNQARKVQELLANLGGVTAALPPPAQSHPPAGNNNRYGPGAYSGPPPPSSNEYNRPPPPQNSAPAYSPNQGNNYPANSYNPPAPQGNNYNPPPVPFPQNNNYNSLPQPPPPVTYPAYPPPQTQANNPSNLLSLLQRPVQNAQPNYAPMPIPSNPGPPSGGYAPQPTQSPGGYNPANGGQTNGGYGYGAPTSGQPDVSSLLSLLVNL